MNKGSKKPLKQLFKEQLVNLGLREGIILFGSLSLSGLGSALAWLIASDFWQILVPYKILLSIIAAILGMIIPVLIYGLVTKNKHEPSDIKFDFEILEKKIKHEYKDRENLSHTRTMKLKALKDGLTAYPGQYHWTGSNKPIIKSTKPEHGIQYEERENVWQPYLIKFNERLNKGDTIDVEIVFVCNDASRAKPFFSSTTEVPTNKLILELKVPPEWKIPMIRCEEFIRDGAMSPNKNEIKYLDNDGGVKWEINEPELLYQYVMKWNIS